MPIFNPLCNDAEQLNVEVTDNQGMPKLVRIPSILTREENPSSEFDSPAQQKSRPSALIIDPPKLERRVSSVIREQAVLPQLQRRVSKIIPGSTSTRCCPRSSSLYFVGFNVDQLDEVDQTCYFATCLMIKPL